VIFFDRLSDITYPEFCKEEESFLKSLWIYKSWMNIVHYFENLLSDDPEQLEDYPDANDDAPFQNNKV
jgi:hypothetical protein